MAATQFWGVGRLGTVQSVAYTGTAGTIANSVGSQTYKVRVLTTSDAYIAIGNSVTASTANGTYVVGLTPEYFTITPGQVVSALQVSAAGTLNVTELA